MDSINNFIWDSFIKSFESKDSFIQDTQNFLLKDKKKIAKSYFDQFDYWERIFNNRVSYLRNNVKINWKNKFLQIDDAKFHSVYGWLISSGNIRSYLGKSSICDGVSIFIGNRTYLSGHSTIRGVGNFFLGSYCSIGFGLYVNVSDENQPIDFAASIGLHHEPRMKQKNFSLPLSYGLEDKATNLRQTTIKNDVWIGRNAGILNNIKIDNGVVIGANSLVTKDCDPYGVYVGSPAKLVRYRFSKKIINQLLQIKWWDWSDERILKNVKFFDTDLTKFDGNLNEIIL